MKEEYKDLNKDIKVRRRDIGVRRRGIGVRRRGLLGRIVRGLRTPSLILLSLLPSLIQGVLLPYCRRNPQMTCVFSLNYLEFCGFMCFVF